MPACGRIPAEVETELLGDVALRKTPRLSVFVKRAFNMPFRLEFIIGLIPKTEMNQRYPVGRTIVQNRADAFAVCHAITPFRFVNTMLYDVYESFGHYCNIDCSVMQQDFRPFSGELPLRRLCGFLSDRKARSGRFSISCCRRTPQTQEQTRRRRNILK